MSVKARFIDPMLLLKTEMLPEGSDLLYEIKLDGYRAIAFKTGGKVYLRSRNDNDFAVRYPSIATALLWCKREGRWSMRDRCHDWCRAGDPQSHL